MKLVALYKDSSGVDYHRILLPLKHLQVNEGDEIIQVSSRNPVAVELLENANIVLYSRECPFELDQLLDFRPKFGFKIVVDIDDYWRLYPKHILYDSWLRNSTTDHILKSIQTADYVTTTHRYLADKIAEFNKSVEVIPNALPYGEGQFTDNHNPSDVILYSCGASHLEDIKILRRFFELCKNNGDIQKYQFRVAGYNAGNFESMVLWDKIEKEAKAFGNYKRVYSLPLTSYMKHYQDAKICIAPLENNEFNRCKSNLKVLEAGCKKIPILTSDMHPYTEIPGVLTCSTQRDWYTNLKRLINDPSFLKAEGEKLYNYVRENYNLLKVNELRRQLYDQWGSN